MAKRKKRETVYSMREVKGAIQVILDDTEKYETTLNWCVDYCRHAMQVVDGYEMGIQILYILNNLRTWRHPRRKEVVEILNNFDGED